MGDKKKDTPQTVWFSLKKSLHCKSEASDVHNPKTRKQLGAILTRKPGSRSGCSRSMENLRDVIHGSKRHLERPNNCSPRSIGSTEFLNPIAHEVILSGGSMQYLNPSFCRKGDGGVCWQKRASFEKERIDNGIVCHKCGEQFVHWGVLETHHLSNHAGCPRKKACPGKMLNPRKQRPFFEYLEMQFRFTRNYHK